MSGRLLVVGASGLVGTEVMRAAGEGAYGVARAVGGLAVEAMDLLDPKAIEGVVTKVNPGAVVVASAWPWVDGCEQDPARSQRENVQTVKNLIQVLGVQARIIFFSTEHVFDGVAPAYDEHAPTHPLSVYARHKREVEELLLTRGHALIARTSYVFGAEVRRKNFMYRVIDASEQRTPLKVPSAQAGIPTWSKWLASSALTLSSRGTDGLVHLTGPEVLTKAEWAGLIARGLALPNVEIVEVPWQESGQIAPRPERVRLLNTKHELHHPPLLELLTREHESLLSKVN
jgi:dTDP-4-dehydrorhamnose reductase